MSLTYTADCRWKHPLSEVWDLMTLASAICSTVQYTDVMLHYRKLDANPIT